MKKHSTGGVKDMKRTRSLRFLPAVCMLLSLLVLFAGCGKTEKTPAPESTAAYRGSKLDLGSLEVLPTFLPRYDEGSGELTICVRQADVDKVVGTVVLRRSDENGGWDTADGSFREIAPEDGGEPLQGVLLPDGWVALSRDPAGQITLEVDHGGERVRASLRDLLRESDPREIAVSDAGGLCRESSVADIDMAGGAPIEDEIKEKTGPREVGFFHCRFLLLCPFISPGTSPRRFRCTSCTARAPRRSPRGPASRSPSSPPDARRSSAPH